MKYLFCVTSALGINYGKYSYEERFHQLIDSFRSIKKYVPNSDIILFDSTLLAIPKSDSELLKQLCVKAFNMDEHPIAELCRRADRFNDDPKRMYIKTMSELANLDAIVSCSDPLKYSRVFKLTGRYRVNQHFNIVDYTLADGKICVLDPVTWDRTIFPMRLWSFDTSITELMKGLVLDMINNIENDDKTYNIIEQSFYHWIHQRNIPYYPVKIIGCEGNMFDGHFLSE